MSTKIRREPVSLNANNIRAKPCRTTPDEKKKRTKPSKEPKNFNEWEAELKKAGEPAKTSCKF